MELSSKAKEAIARGSFKIRVVRSGMLQQLTFCVKKVTLGNVTYIELATERQVDLSEITKIANDIGLPVEAQNGRAFPKGTSATDFAEL
jgi:hypothetical protein